MENKNDGIQSSTGGKTKSLPNPPIILKRIKKKSKSRLDVDEILKTKSTLRYSTNFSCVSTLEEQDTLLNISSADLYAVSKLSPLIVSALCTLQVVTVMS